MARKKFVRLQKNISVIPQTSVTYICNSVIEEQEVLFFYGYL